jgi:hypothetical protein
MRKLMPLMISTHSSGKTWYLNLLSLLILVIISTTGCSNSKELTRSHATLLIQNSDGFSKPDALFLKIEDDVRVAAKSIDQSEQEAKDQAVNLFYQSNPSMAVAGYLGLIDVKATVVKCPQAIKGPEFRITRPDGTSVNTPPVRLPNEIEPWHIKVETSLTEKGKQASSDVQGNDGRALALYRREVVQITGVTTAQKAQAQAEFTWRVIPTTYGEAFDSTSETYKNLPPELQRAVREPTGIFGGMATKPSGKIHKSTAYFRFFDDGWRLVGVQ